MRELKPGGFLSDAIIDTLIGLLPAAEDSVYLGFKFYLDLEEELETGRNCTKKWIQGMQQDKGCWLFVYEDSVIGVNWPASEIEYYHPQCSGYPVVVRREERFKVSI